MPGRRHHPHPALGPGPARRDRGRPGWPATRARECPILGAPWERRSAVKSDQTQSDDVNASRLNTPDVQDASDEACCSSVRSARDEKANPGTKTPTTAALLDLQRDSDLEQS